MNYNAQAPSHDKFTTAANVTLCAIIGRDMSGGQCELSDKIMPMYKKNLPLSV